MKEETKELLITIGLAIGTAFACGAIAWCAYDNGYKHGKIDAKLAECQSMIAGAKVIEYNDGTKIEFGNF